jgi:hypothetical protein
MALHLKNGKLGKCKRVKRAKRVAFKKPPFTGWIGRGPARQGRAGHPL